MSDVCCSKQLKGVNHRTFRHCQPVIDATTRPDHAKTTAGDSKNTHDSGLIQAAETIVKIFKNIV
jgi:hypothetical protein